MFIFKAVSWFEKSAHLSRSKNPRGNTNHKVEKFRWILRSTRESLGATFACIINITVAFTVSDRCSVVQSEGMRKNSVFPVFRKLVKKLGRKIRKVWALSELESPRQIPHLMSYRYDVLRLYSFRVFKNQWVYLVWLLYYNRQLSVLSLLSSATY